MGCRVVPTAVRGKTYSCWRENLLLLEGKHVIKMIEGKPATPRENIFGC